MVNRGLAWLFKLNFTNFFDFMIGQLIALVMILLLVILIRVFYMLDLLTEDKFLLYEAV